MQNDDKKLYEMKKTPRPPLTVPPDEVLQGGFEPAEDGTLTFYAAQRVTWVYRCKGYDASLNHV